MFETIDLSIDRSVAYATLNRPDKLNAINETWLGDMAKVIERVEGDEAIRALVFRGKGRGFCVGLDLGLLIKAFDDITYFESIVRRLNALLLRIERLPVPVVCAVNGFARAGGFELALASDIVLIAEEAKIGDQHTHVHVMPGGGATQRLPRRIGLQRAKELIWSARWLTGREAAEIGLALKAVPLAELDAAVEALVKDYRDRPRALIAAIKSAMSGGAQLPIEQAVELEIKTFVAYMGGHPHARAAFRASLKKA